MITLLDADRDALIEICNIGMSKAAKQLSALLNSEILISIPEINLMNQGVVDHQKLFGSDQTLAYVYQNLSQDIDGRAVLVFQREHTSLLTQAVIGKAPKMTAKEIRACEREAMLEIGNIIITSCISAIVNMLSKEVKLSVPFYDEDKIISLLDNQIKNVSEFSQDIIMIATKLETSNQEISGKLLLILTEGSIVTLFNSIKAMLK